MKALLLAALLVSTAPGDSAVVDVKGNRGTVSQAQFVPRMIARQNCSERRDDYDLWWYYEVRCAPPGGVLTLYNSRGRAFDGTPPCAAWPSSRIGFRLHGFLGARPGDVHSATYTTPSGTTYTFKRGGEQR